VLLVSPWCRVVWRTATLAGIDVVAAFTADAEMLSVAIDISGRTIVAGDQLGTVHLLTVRGAEI